MASKPPFFVQQQIGFGDWYLEVTSTISVYTQSGEYNQVQLSYANTAGNFQENLFLSPQVTSIPAHLVTLGQQQFSIIAINFSGATTEQSGTVYLKGTFTRLDGKVPVSFNGQICSWLTTGAVTPATLKHRFS